MFDDFAFIPLCRAGDSQASTGKTARTSIDFTVNGHSLLQALVDASGGHGDFMGCFVSGFPDANSLKYRELLGEAPPGWNRQDVILYSCPECGDIACGAYAVNIRVGEETVEWSGFSYVNGDDPSSAIDRLGPFTFARRQYETVLRTASII